MIQNERLSPCTLPSLISSPSCFGGSPITTPVKAPPAAFRSKVRLSTGPPGTSKEPFHLPVASAANATAPSSSERLRATRVRFMGVILSLQEEPSKFGDLFCRGQIESSGSGQVESSAFRPRAKAKPAIPSSQDCVPAWRPGPVKTAPGLRAEEAVLTGGRYARRYRLREWQGNASR